MSLLLDSFKRLIAQYKETDNAEQKKLIFQTMFLEAKKYSETILDLRETAPEIYSEDEEENGYNPVRFSFFCADAVIIADFLQQHPVFQKIYLSDHYIEEEGAMALLSVFEKNKTLTYFDLANNYISQGTLQQFSKISLERQAFSKEQQTLSPASSKGSPFWTPLGEDSSDVDELTIDDAIRMQYSEIAKWQTYLSLNFPEGIIRTEDEQAIVDNYKQSILQQEARIPTLNKIRTGEPVTQAELDHLTKMPIFEKFSSYPVKEETLAQASTEPSTSGLVL
jgi:hypothetical protein